MRFDTSRCFVVTRRKGVFLNNLGLGHLNGSFVFDIYMVGAITCKPVPRAKY